jgi:hypothetical protein
MKTLEVKRMKLELAQKLISEIDEELNLPSGSIEDAIRTIIADALEKTVHGSSLGGGAQ